MRGVSSCASIRTPVADREKPKQDGPHRRLTTNPTSLAFGGPDYRTLFITTARFQLNADQLKREPLAGAVLKMRADVAGIAEPSFNG